MEFNKCPGCMEPFQGEPCPRCGFDRRKTAGMEYALPLNTILAGKYVVGRVLGQGGFGITYIGWDLALERKVAIKEYYPSNHVSRSQGTRNLTWYTTEQANKARTGGMEMFLKEARKMVKVDGIPGIVRVLELFQENGTAYIVMEYVEGETLKARLQKTGPLSWSQAKEIFEPVVHAMVQVHRAGLIHRDLSPDNLMLTPDGKVKILDLGAAKDLNVSSGVSSMQVAKTGFSPLEQYTQRGSSGPWTDVYAIAATIYYTLTGKLPPNAIDRLDQDTLSWTEPGLSDLPSAALAALEHAMAVQMSDRIQTMDELEQRLFSASIPQAPPTAKAAQTAQANEQLPKVAPMRRTYSRFLLAAMTVIGILLLVVTLAENSVPANFRGSNTGQHYTNNYFGIQCTLGSSWNLLSDAEVLKTNGLGTHATLAEYESALIKSGGLADMIATNSTDASLLQVQLGKTTLLESLFSEATLLDASKDTVFEKLNDGQKITVQTMTSSQITLAGKTHPCIRAVCSYENVPLYITYVYMKRGTNIAIVAAWSFMTDNTAQMLNSFQPL